jgi:hypothetical protein
MASATTAADNSRQYVFKLTRNGSKTHRFLFKGTPGGHLYHVSRLFLSLLSLETAADSTPCLPSLFPFESCPQSLSLRASEYYQLHRGRFVFTLHAMTTIDSEDAFKRYVIPALRQTPDRKGRPCVTLDVVRVPHENNSIRWNSLPQPMDPATNPFAYDGERGAGAAASPAAVPAATPPARSIWPHLGEDDEFPPLSIAPPMDSSVAQLRSQGQQQRAPVLPPAPSPEEFFKTFLDPHGQKIFGDKGAARSATQTPSSSHSYRSLSTFNKAEPLAMPVPLTMPMTATSTSTATAATVSPPRTERIFEEEAQDLRTSLKEMFSGFLRDLDKMLASNVGDEQLQPRSHSQEEGSRARSNDNTKECYVKGLDSGDGRITVSSTHIEDITCDK